ncbi:MAG: TIGR03546 family protein [Gemmatimonadales bacterium]|nr:TIGR03546 family protein [Gemmatimonadales bacterium]NIN09848.1 TIGR03546 family protein [Gemmatimonadales bacterium]NIN48551.1 TIGR03546 family protein [Gemmatimonadales bacterium]NIP06015.1 TIGR03546 family protein [Gemmatimonadales bacterium]NIR01164.1 TIGR03546 family protein [Gemmatimonadales bacterium]
MFTLLKIIQSITRSLHSEGTPAQVAVGVALGAALGLTPLVSPHNLLVVAAIALFNVSVPGAILGLLVALPFGFMLDPVFDAIGKALLLEAPVLTPLWTTTYNTPLLSLASLNNTVVLGSLIGWLVLSLPIFYAARFGVARYRATLHPLVARSKVYQAVRASKLYNLYRLFQP